MSKYRLEMTHGQDQRTVEADKYIEHDGWLIFYRKPATGGMVEHLRVCLKYVVCMETVQ